MKTKSTYLYCAVLVAFSGIFGLAQAQDAQSAAVAKASPNVVKSAKASKPVKISKLSKKHQAASKSKTAPQTVSVSAAPVASQPLNPFWASQASNPYLAYRYEKPYQPSRASASPATERVASSSPASQRPAISKISFAPMPVNIYLNPHQKPTMAVTTPCSLAEKMTGNSPMFKAFEQMAFGMIGKVNDAGFMPMLIEPVCT